ncbi:hypothetical protein V6N12_042415 [Hibiscus sabdariffa]|uniref:Uncharacterized protein n=1 Tax=Hibiscus sabdariffa TaxID=183260 RepID=A0ABR2EER1_9ROSI
MYTAKEVKRQVDEAKRDASKYKRLYDDHKKQTRIKIQEMVPYQHFLINISLWSKEFRFAARESLPTFSTFPGGAKGFGLQLVNPYQHFQHFLVEQRVSACNS